MIWLNLLNIPFGTVAASLCFVAGSHWLAWLNVGCVLLNLVTIARQLLLSSEVE